MEVALVKMACLLSLLRHCMKTPMPALLFKPEKELDRAGACVLPSHICENVRSFGVHVFVKRRCDSNNSVYSFISSNTISSIFRLCDRNLTKRLGKRERKERTWQASMCALESIHKLPPYAHAVTVPSAAPCPCAMHVSMEEEARQQASNAWAVAAHNEVGEIRVSVINRRP